MLAEFIHATWYLNLKQLVDSSSTKIAYFVYHVEKCFSTTNCLKINTLHSFH